MAIKITGTFSPGGDFPLLVDNDLKGGWRVVDTASDRDAIPVLNRKFGMIVYVKEDGKQYQLIDSGSGDLSDNSQWVEFSSGGGSYTFTNGLTENNNEVKLGGTLIEDTQLALTTNYYFKFVSDGGNLDRLEINFKDTEKKILGAVQGSSLFESGSFLIQGDSASLRANKDNGDNTSTQYYFTISNNKEINSNVQALKIKNDEYGITQINLENANSADNYTGASFVVTSSDTQYQDNTYMSHYGSNFYVPEYQNTGSLFSDKTLWIGNPYSKDERVNFVLGDAFNSPRVRMWLDKKGLTLNDNEGLTLLKDRTSAFYEDITQNHLLFLTNNNGKVFSHNKSMPERFIKRGQRNGEDYVSASETLDFGFYFIKSTSLVKLYKNGVELEFGTDWDWAQFPEMPTTSPRPLDYTTKVKLLNYSPSSSDTFVLEYSEYTVAEMFFDIRLIAWDGTDMLEARNKRITKFIDVNGHKYYLDSVSKSGHPPLYTLTYRKVSDTSVTYTIEKRFFNAAYFPGYIPNSGLDFEIEVWRENVAQSTNNKKNVYNRPPKQLSGHLVPAWRTNKNLLPFGSSSGSLKYRTVYYIRFRFEDNAGNPYFSPFMPYKISRKYFNIFTTNATGTTDNYVGVYDMLKVIY